MLHAYVLHSNQLLACPDKAMEQEIPLPFTFFILIFMYSFTTNLSLSYPHYKHYLFYKPNIYKIAKCISMPSYFFKLASTHCLNLRNSCWHEFCATVLYFSSIHLPYAIPSIEHLAPAFMSLLAGLICFVIAYSVVEFMVLLASPFFWLHPLSIEMVHDFLQYEQEHGIGSCNV